MLLGQLLAMTFNINRSRDSKPMTCEDFMPLGEPKPAEEARPPTFDELQRFLGI